MKKLFYLTALAFIATKVSLSQDILVFKGTVKCFFESDERASRGAKNVVVVPGFVPGKASLTNPQGYYELNTAAPLQKLEGKYVMLYFVSSCKTCEIKQNVFVSEDQIRQTSNAKLSYLTVETLQMKASCKSAEPKPLQSDSLYNVFARLPAQDLEKVSGFNVLTATPGVLNVLTNAVAVVTIGSGDADTSSIFPGKIKYGRFLAASAMNLSANTGFNFSPNRDFSEAVFWNAAALANSYQNTGIHFFGNFKNNYKLSAYRRLTDKLMLGAGGIYTQQDEIRLTTFGNSLTTQHLRSLKEYAVYLSPSYKPNSAMSLGVSGKFIGQNFNRPVRLLTVNNQVSAIDSNVNNHHFDVDVSFVYRPVTAFQIGVNLMNLAGTKLDADALPAKKKLVPVQQLRSFGLGLCYKWKQFNFGTDVLITQNDLYDVSLGVNYIPINNVLLSGGYAFKRQSFSLGLRVKYFRVGYINDNDLLVNDKRKGKSGILNGQLYSGLSFTF